MLDLGIVKPGTTIYIPFNTFDSNDPSASVTLTGLATTDIEVYRDGSVTQRASDAGYALLDTDGIDFDSITGIHGISIDLSNNTTAGFYRSGGQYWVVISSVTVDAATINFVAATFRIGYPDSALNTYIDTLASQTSFTLPSGVGPGDDDALNGWKCVIHDVASAVQVCVGYVSDYTGSTRTVTLAADPGIFTIAASDNVHFYLPDNVQAIQGNSTNATNLGTAASNYSATRGLSGTALPAAAADAAGGLPISDAGGLDLDAMNTNINDIETDTNELQTDDIPGLIAALNDPTSAAIADAVWDEVLTGATHNVTNSAGRRLRQLEAAAVLHEGTAQAGSLNTITLDTGANANDDFYNHTRIVITEGTGIEQERIVVDYNGTTKVATIAPPWVTNPDNTSIFEVEPGLSHAETNSKTVKVGIAQAATASTITLSTDASATDDFYNDNVVMIDAGTGEGQERIITDYNGTTKVATIEPNWLVNPDTTSEYIIEEALCVADVFAISNDETAADNLELDYDGTGFDKANSTIGTTTTNTDMRGTDNAALASALATVDSNVDAILLDTNELQTDDVPGLIAALNNISVSDILTTQMTEAYAADGTAPTLAQAIFAILQQAGEFAISGTTITVKKLDGSTTAMTFTLDDASNPTSRTRAT